MRCIFVLLWKSPVSRFWNNTRRRYHRGCSIFTHLDFKQQVMFFAFELLHVSRSCWGSLSVKPTRHRTGGLLSYPKVGLGISSIALRLSHHVVGGQ